MDDNKLEAKLLKIKALAERGEGGEKEAAIKMYHKLLKKYDIDEKARDTLLFYFESLMNRKQGIPQGKVNCVSDLYGLLYLLPLDFNIIDICDKYDLEYKAMIRYVDDTMIIFRNKNNLTNKEIFKELSKLEQELSLFLNNELMLRINEKKTEYAIMHNKDVRKEFIENNTKKVSNVNNTNTDNTNSGQETNGDSSIEVYSTNKGAQ